MGTVGQWCNAFLVTKSLSLRWSLIGGTELPNATPHTSSIHISNAACEREEEKKQTLIFCEQFETQKRALQQKKASLASRKKSLCSIEGFLGQLEKQFSDSFYFRIFSSSACFQKGALKVLQFTDIFLISLVHFLVGILRGDFSFIYRSREGRHRQKDETELKLTAKEFPF